MKTNEIIFFSVCFILSSLILDAQAPEREQDYREADPFAKYIERTPTAINLIEELNEGAGIPAITITKFTYPSRDSTNTIYAIHARPQKKDTYPAILFFHGGGSGANDLIPLLKKYARPGIVAFAIDQPGICGQEKAPNSKGPWKNRPEGQMARYDMRGGAHTSTLADAGVAAIEGFNWIRSQPEVDPYNIGLTGFSWGGYTTMLLSGILGNRVKAAYAVFGCGFHDKGSVWMDIILKMPEAEKNTWIKYIDAGRRAKHISASFFHEATTNDTYFWPEAVEQSFRSINGNKNLVWVPNLNHQRFQSGPKMQEMFFDYYLKGLGLPFPKVINKRSRSRANGDRTINVWLSFEKAIIVEDVKLYYSERGENWQERRWIALSMRKKGGKMYTTNISRDLVSKNIDYFIYVKDTRNVVVSSNMYQALNSDELLQHE